MRKIDKLNFVGVRWMPDARSRDSTVNYGIY